MVVPTYNYYVSRYEEGRETYEQMEQILDTIPDDASVCVSTFLLPHVADREVVYELTYHENADDVDYVVFDMRYALSAQDKQSKKAYLDNGYEIVSEHKNMILILKKTN
jgi:hypothetical protein